MFIFPILYKSLVYFYSSSVEIKHLEDIKEELIIHISSLFISGDLALEI